MSSFVYANYTGANTQQAFLNYQSWFASLDTFPGPTGSGKPWNDGGVLAIS